MCHVIWHLVLSWWLADGRLMVGYQNILIFNFFCSNIYNVSYHPQKGYVTLILFPTTILVLDTKNLFYVPLFLIKFLYIPYQTSIVLLFAPFLAYADFNIYVFLPTCFLFFCHFHFHFKVPHSSLLSRIILCHHSSSLLPQTMDYFETHGGYDKDIKYLEENKFLKIR